MKPRQMRKAKANKQKQNKGSYTHTKMNEAKTYQRKQSTME